LGTLSRWRSTLGLPSLGIGRHLARRRRPRDITVEHDGLVLRGSPDHRHFLQMLADGTREETVGRLFVAAITPGAVVIDVGAHIGWYTLLAARAGASVVALEPDPRNLPYLARNCAANGFTSRVTIIPAAVAATPGAQLLHLGTESQMSSLYDVPAVAGQDSVSVDVVVLSDVAPPGARVVKIDVEGGELGVLAGLPRSVTTLFVELYPRGLAAAGTTARVLIERLEALGFDVALVDETSGATRDLTSLDPDWWDGTTTGEWDHANLVATRPVTSHRGPDADVS
jgi:FkbM family methyltransferase